MPENIQSGSWVGDTVEEFKKLPTGGKIAVGGGAILLIVIAVYLYYKHSSASSAANTAAAGQATTLPATQNPPITNAEASLAPTTPSPSLPTVTSIMASIRPQQTTGYDVSSPGIVTRSSPGGSVTGTIPYASQIAVNGPPVSGPNNFGQNNPSGSSVWYNTPSGYVSGYDVNGLSASTSTGQGNGSGGLSSYTLQQGDNLNEIAAKLGLGGGWSSLVGSNPGPLVAGQAIQVPRQ